MSVAQRVRQADLARMLNVTRQSISELVARKVITQDADGLIDVELARVAIANRVRPSAKTAAAAVGVTVPAGGAAAPANVPAGGMFRAARDEREMAEAQMAKLRLLEATGKALDADEVARLTYEKARIARDAVMGVAPRIYQQLAAESDPHKVLQLLQAELRRACAEIAAGEAGQTRQ